MTWVVYRYTFGRGYWRYPFYYNETDNHLKAKPEKQIGNLILTQKNTKTANEYSSLPIYFFNAWEWKLYIGTKKWLAIKRDKPNLNKIFVLLYQIYLTRLAFIG